MLKLKILCSQKEDTLQIESKKIYVSITELPYLNDLRVTTGDEGIIIQYKVSGQSPEVQRIDWRKDGKVLNTNVCKYIGGSINDSSLTIRSPTEEDKGNYSCIITNAVGSVSKDVILSNFHVFY